MRNLLCPLFFAVALFACADQQRPLQVEPRGLQFGEVAVGETSRRTFKVTNPGELAVELTFAASEPYAVGFTRVSLPSGQSVEVPVTFAPTEARDYQRGVAVRQGSAPPIAVDVTGRGVVATEDGCGTPGLCQAFRRVDGGCELVTAPNGSACTTRCAPQGLCVEGVCEGFNPACDDSNLCTTDSCSEAVGCGHLPITCPSPTTCQSAYCDPNKGCSVAPVADGTPCGSTACGAVDVCKAGVCERMNQTTPNCSLNSCGVTLPLNDCTASFCFENPLPVYGGFSDGYVRSATDVWFVNRYSGAIYRWNGTAFSLHSQPGGDLTGILVKAVDDIWIAATDLPPRHWDGTKWTSCTLSPGDRCTSLTQTNNGDIACAGYQKVYILSPNGTATPIGGDNGNQILRGGGGASWVVSSNGEVRRVLGLAGMTYAGSVLSSPRDLAVDSSGRAFVATSSSGVVRFDSTGSTNLLHMGSYIDTVSATGTKLLAVANNGALYSYDGQSTKYLASMGTTGGGFNGEPITVVNENDIWLQGSELQHYDGLGAKAVSCGASASDLTVLRSTPDGGAFAASYNQIFRREEARWSALPATGSYRITDLMPFSPNEVWASNENGQLFRVSASGPAALSGPTNRYVTSVWGTSASDLYAGTTGNQNEPVMHFDGTTWSRAATPDAGSTYLYVVSMHGSGPNDVWALLRDQNTYRVYVWRWDGTSWKDMNFPVTSSDTPAIRRHGNKTRVTVRYQYWFYELDGNTWTAYYAPYSTLDLAEVNGKLYGFTSLDLQERNADGGWSVAKRLTTGVDSIAPLGTNELLVGGGYGMIAKFRPQP